MFEIVVLDLDCENNIVEWTVYVFYDLVEDMSFWLV